MVVLFLYICCLIENNIKPNLIIMKKYLQFVLLLFAFAGFINAQPASTANWFGYLLPPNPAEYKFISFTMQDLGSVSVASDVISPVNTAFDMQTGELFGAHYGNLYQLDPNTGIYTMLGALHEGSTSYDPTCLFMAYGSNPSNPTEFTVGDLNYRVNDDNVSVTVTGHVDGYNAQGPLVIPESVSYGGNDYAVTTIGNSAFLYYFYLTSLTLPNSLTTIEDGAFAYCSGFTGDLIIPNSVVTIGPSAFFTCYAFDGELVIGNSVTTIGEYAFDDCNGMHGVLNIPSNVTSIGLDAFRYCEFSGMTVNRANHVFDSRDNCNAIIRTSNNELVTGCANTVIPTSVTAIGENAFCGLDGLTSIDIPNSIISIGAGAFSFCFNLTGDLTIPNSVETIGSGAFFQCSGFDGKLTIGSSVKFIGDYAFRQCSHFTKAVSLATVPPELGNEQGWNCVVFEQFGTQTLTVPFGCAAAYQNSNWYDPMGLNGFYEFIEAEPQAISEVENTISTVYPNPTNGITRIEAENIRNISIFDIHGAKVHEVSASGNAYEYDFSHQAAGVYLIKVETAKGIETKRVTVL